MTRPFRALLPLAVASLALCVPGYGQSDPVFDTSVLETVDVDVVNVEVYVTDGQGRTVDGLTADDFRLFVDRRPTEISNFYRADGAVPDKVESVSEVQRTAVSGDTSAEPEPRRPSKPATLVIYVDHLQLTPGGRRSFLRQIRDFLTERLTPGDQAMVVSHSGSLQLEQRFSGDFGEVDAVLEDLWRAPAGALDYRLKWRGSMDQIEQLIMSTPRQFDPCEMRGDQMRDVALAYADFVSYQAETSLASLQRLAQILGAFEGRKAILYLSEGLHQSPGGDMLLKMSEICPGRSFEASATELATHIVGRAFELTRLANASGVTIHTLDAARLEGNSSTGVGSSRELDFYGRTFDLRENPSVDRRRRESRQGSLYTLAHETGGLAVLNANVIDVDLGKIEDSLRRFYSLGFTPQPNAEEGSIHSVRVELVPPRKGHTLHHRRSYTETRDDRTAARLMSALLLGHQENPLGIDIRIGPAQVGDNGLPTMPLRVAVPFGTLGWLEHGDYRTAEVELFIAVQSGDGDDIDMRRKTIPFKLKESLWTTAQASTHTLEIALPVPSTDARLAFAVADRIGSRTSYLSPDSVPQTVPQPAPPGTSGY